MSSNNGNDFCNEPGDIGNFLKNRRIDKDLTQLELGNILNVSPKTISKWENNNGFPDQLYQMPLCNALDITLEELHSGRLNIKQRNKEKKETRIKFALVFFIGILLIIIVILFALLVYYKHFYNPLTLKYIDVTNDEQTVCNIDGYYIKDRCINMLYIGNIKLLTDDIANEDLVEVNFIYKDEVVYSTTSLKNISINLYSVDNPNDIKVEIIVKDFNTEKEKYHQNFKIDFLEINTKREIVQYSLNTKYMIKELTNMGFEKINNDRYKKSSKEESVTYNNLSETLIINTFGDNKFTINYKMISGDINVSLNSNVKGDFIVTEKYSYNIYDDALINDVGYGYSLDVVLKMLEPYINLRNRYLVSTN